MNFLKNRHLANLSNISVLELDSDHVVLKKRILTILPFYIFIPALVWSLIYLYLGNFQAFLVPIAYIIISLLSTFYLYKTKKFHIFEFIQLLLILFLPFILMWVLGGFKEGSYVMIWSFYAPLTALMYSENFKVGMKWFSAFLILVTFSVIIDADIASTIQNSLPLVVSESFIFLNISIGLGGIFFLMGQFITNIKDISTELKNDKESLYHLTNELKNANKELEQLANCDLITELPNRLCFQDIVYDMFLHANQNEKIVAIMFLDLDGFKTINDTLGHEAGDVILKVVAERLKAVIRSSDTVARIGGDEFAIAVGDISDVEHVKQIATSLIREVNEFCPYEDKKCHVGVSIGISFYPQHGTTLEELMQRADTAMYNIKRMGKNNYSIYKEE